MDTEPFQHRLTPAPHSASDIPWQIDLAGAWQLSPRAPEAAGARPLAELGETHTVQVPGSPALQGIQIDPQAWLALEYTLPLPPGWSNRRILLQAEGIAHEARLWLNGRQIGQHQGAFTPSEWDVTEALAGAREARLTVVAKDQSLANSLSGASAYAAFPLVGIIRPIRLLALPRVHLASLRLRTPLSKDLSRASVDLQVQLRGPFAQREGQAQLLATLISPEAHEVARQRVTLNAAATTLSLTVDKPTLWDPEHPNLYTLELTLLTPGAEPEQQHRASVGIRKIEVDGHTLLINGRGVKLRGVCRHETHPLSGRSVPDALARRDAELFKAANINFVRCVHYPPSPAFVAACDALGLFVEIEAPICWAFGSFDKTPRWHELDEHTQAASQTYILSSSRAMVEQFANNPSVLLWSLANESQWEAPFLASAQQLAQLDPDRPSTFNWATFQDDERAYCALANDHYPGLEGAHKHAHGPRPVLFGEYCHLNSYNRGELQSDPGVREVWGDHLARMWQAMRQSPGVLGGAIWSGIDDMFWHQGDAKGPRWAGYGEWGIIDGWRREKPEYHHVHRVYAPVQVDVQQLRRQGDTLFVSLENRYDFTDLRELSVELTAGEKRKALTLSLPPHTSGTLIVDVTGLGPRLPITLTFHDLQGRLVQRVTLPSQDCPEIKTEDDTASPPRLHQSERRFQLELDGVSIQIDRHSGALSAAVQGRPIIVGGPQLVIYPEEPPWRSEQLGPAAAPLTNLCTNFQLEKIRVLDERALRVAGRYLQAEGSFVLFWHGAPWLTVEASFIWHGPSTLPFATGIEFALAARFQRLSWARPQETYSYPADHLGRPQGEAEAFSAQAEPVGAPYPPQGTWSQQFSCGGSHDFRSTKRAFKRAALSSAQGEAFRLRATGQQHLHAIMDEPIVRVAIFQRYSGGSEVFYAGIRDTPTRLEPGDEIRSTFSFALSAPAC